jgi:hypothetical protein
MGDVATTEMEARLTDTYSSCQPDGERYMIQKRSPEVSETERESRIGKLKEADLHGQVYSRCCWMKTGR